VSTQQNNTLNIDLDNFGTTTRAPTGRASLSQAIHSLQEALGHLENDQFVQAQMGLEAALLDMLLAMQLLGINPEAALQRAVSRLETASRQDERVLIVYPDRVELRSEGECRGTWPVFSDDEVCHYIDMAYELGCRVVHADARQTGLF
jgi:hypothetical protein